MVLKDATESEEGNRRSILGTGTPIPSVELMMWVLVDGVCICFRVWLETSVSVIADCLAWRGVEKEGKLVSPDIGYKK